MATIVEIPSPNPYGKFSTNAKYNKYIHTFMTWVAREGKRTNDGKYLTRDNVDEFYEEVVEHQFIRCQNDSAYACHRALQQFANVYERPPNGGAPLTIRDKNNPNARVNQSLWRREIRFVEWTRIHGETDPHANLPTNSLSFEEHARTMRYLLGNTEGESMWEQFSISWTVDFSTYLRIDSLRKMGLCDLVCELRGFETEGPNQDCLGLIMQKHLHKGHTNPQNPSARNGGAARNNTAGDSNGMAGGPIAMNGKRVVFMWRHRVFECCGTAMIAISLFMRLFFDTEFSFLEKEVQPPAPTARANVPVPNTNSPGRARNNNNVSNQ
jgi:hypothetical protein